MWYICHRAREIRIYFPEMQMWNRVAQDTTLNVAHCKVQQCVWNTLVKVTLPGDSTVRDIPQISIVDHEYPALAQNWALSLHNNAS